LESTKQDKRTIVRRRTQQLVYLELGRENGGVMLNLSEQGCGFQAITPVKPGETRFAFQINGGRRIAGDAEVVWADESGIMGGLRFLNLPVEAHREIRLWLNETNAPPEPGFVSTGSPVAAGARRTRAIGSETGTTPAAGVRVAEEEPPVPALPPPAWLNLRAGNYAPVDDSRYRASFHRDEGAYGAPTRGGSGVWRGIAITATVVALAALVIVYQRDVGTSLIWLGETLTGKTKASSVVPSTAVPEKPPASAAPSSEISGKAENSTSSPAAANKNDTTVPVDSGLARDKELATAGRGDGLGGVAPDGIARQESVLERQAMAQKAEPGFNAGDSVESLWGAVQAGSVSAEVSLAERFARGEGVNKNCDQAKVLMKAAADRGNREARLRLYQMETGGCQ
jgi:PilZ domain